MAANSSGWSSSTAISSWSQTAHGPTTSDHGTRRFLATKHALFFRSTFAPSLATALARSRGVEAARVFTDRLGGGLRCRLVNHPAPLRPLAGVIVLAKQRLT